MTSPRTLIEALEDAAATDRGYRHLKADGSADDQPYARLLADACRVAGALRSLSYPPGTLVGVIAPDASAFLTAFMGITAAGVVPAPLQTPAALGTSSAYARILAPTLRVARAPAVIVQDSIAATLRDAALPGITVLTLHELLMGPAVDPVHAAPDAVAIVQFTSGSTADPRGVVLTHRAIDANVNAIGGPTGLAFSASDRGVSWLPLFHDMGLVGMALSAMYFSRPTTFLPSLTFLKRPMTWLQAIEREGGTVSFAPNFAYELCVRRISDADAASVDLSTWRVAGCGGEPIRPETLERFSSKFRPAGFRATSLTPCYGLAEHTLAVAISPPGRGPRIDKPPGQPAGRAVSSGVSCPGHEIRIAGEDGVTLDERAVGEIEVRGPSLMREYFEAPETTAEVMRDGWLRTGDIGYLSDRELFVCGRRKEMTVLNGRNYFPQDLEWIAADGGARVGKIVAFGVEENAVERLVLLVEPAGHVDREQLTAGIRQRISDAYGISVDEVMVVPAGTITLTTSGKPQRGRAREFYEGERRRASP
jgi:fatty-acyl-CoA synthase